jgi:hypothetical protein
MQHKNAALRREYRKDALFLQDKACAIAALRLLYDQSESLEKWR